MYNCSVKCGQVFKTRNGLCKHRKGCQHAQSAKIKKSLNNKDLITVIEKMEEKMSAVYTKVDELSNEPRTQININNIVLTEKLPSGGPKSFYDEIIKKFGEKSGNDKIVFLAENSDAVGVYQLLYPSEKMSDNPVIYENNEFKFLSDGDKIEYGEQVINRVTKHVKAAMLYASNAIIKASLELNKTEKLYEYYNLGNIQGNALKEKLFRKQISNYIKNKLIFA